MTAGDLFRRIITALDRAGIPHMLTGSFASAYHGSPRATQDIDLVIEADADRIRTLVESLPVEAYYVDRDTALAAPESEGQFNVIDLASGWKVDLMIRKARPFSREEFTRRRPADLQGLSIDVVTAEDLIVAKLEWARSGGSRRQLEDVASILRIRGRQLDIGRVERWVETFDLDSEWKAARGMMDA